MSVVLVGGAQFMVSMLECIELAVTYATTESKSDASNAATFDVDAVDDGTDILKMTHLTRAEVAVALLEEVLAVFMVTL